MLFEARACYDYDDQVSLRRNSKLCRRSAHPPFSCFFAKRVHVYSSDWDFFSLFLRVSSTSFLVYIFWCFGP